jgi:hypothetical protein
MSKMMLLLRSKYEKDDEDSEPKAQWRTSRVRVRAPRLCTHKAPVMVPVDELIVERGEAGRGTAWP